MSGVELKMGLLHEWRRVENGTGAQKDGGGARVAQNEYLDTTHT